MSGTARSLVMSKLKLDHYRAENLNAAIDRIIPVTTMGPIVHRPGPEKSVDGGDIAAFTDSFSPQALQAAIGAIRDHLGMAVAYVSEFRDDRAIFHAVDAPGLDHLIKVGDSQPLDDVYCRHILAGQLPELIPDTSLIPLAQSIPITQAAPIGSHISVPVKDRSGTAIGMFCCFSPAANPTLHDRDLKVMRVFADIMGDQIAAEIKASREAEARSALIDHVIDDVGFSAVFQPIWDLRSIRPVGLEALTRFTDLPYRSPDRWFADAFLAGRGIDLELAAIKLALAALPALPEAMYLSINASARTILSGRLVNALAGCPGQRIMLELTEHEVVDDYEALLAALVPLRRMGIRIAVDDAGAGFASLQHILRLGPDRIKLDMSLTRAIDTDPARRAMVSAMVSFARETGALLIAEGVETSSELETLLTIGVHKGQGYFLGRPADLAATLELVGRKDEPAPWQRMPGLAAFSARSLSL